MEGKFSYYMAAALQNDIGALLYGFQNRVDIENDVHVYHAFLIVFVCAKLETIDQLFNLINLNPQKYMYTNIIFGDNESVINKIEWILNKGFEFKFYGGRENLLALTRKWEDHYDNILIKN